MTLSFSFAVALVAALAVFVAILIARRHGYLGGGIGFGGKCSFCGGLLVHLSGYDRSGPDYGGGSKEVNDFRCRKCGRRYREIVHENFDSIDYWWGLETSGGWTEWTELDKEQWPR